MKGIQQSFLKKLKVKSAPVKPDGYIKPSKPKRKTSSNKQLSIFPAIEKAKKKAASKTVNSKLKEIKTPKQRSKRKPLYRQSILSANSNDTIQDRLNKAGVPNARSKFAPQSHLETGNFKQGKGTYQRGFVQGAELSAKNQYAAAKNQLKRAKRLKRISLKTIGTVAAAGVVSNAIQKKAQAQKIPKGYKMVFGKLRKVDK
jgi:hypothetical protein